MEIVVANETHRDVWLSLRKALWPDCPESRHKIEIEHTLKSAGLVALAMKGAQAIGFAEVSIRVDHVEGAGDSPIPYLEGWYVSPEYRGQGIGRALVTFAENWASDQGYTEMASDAECDNTLSIQIHKTLGFREVGRSVHFIRSLPKN
ncbi:MAG: aminoglycoside 6'-N-acetyltransferase [Opitutales bacterium]